MKRLFVFLFGIFACAVAVAQTETTKWYINGELYATTSCESGGNIDVPTAPENFGYNFAGWEPAIYDMSTLDTSIDGDSSTTSGNKWSVLFSYGTVYGQAVCSTTKPSGNFYVTEVLNMPESGATYCYCKSTDFIPTNSNKIYELVFSKWVYVNEIGNSSSNICYLYCLSFCGNNVRTSAGLRASLYGISQ